ncbi:hypothetical protein MMC34_007577 [Xylographa carneopallida]|nr:hypothetical protein [Xylographa carneopallida]
MAKSTADQYLLRVTAGPDYDSSTHTLVAVNGPTSVPISSNHCTANIKVRVQNYRGLPHGSPTTSPYFSSDPHTHDQYSIAFSMIPHTTIDGNELVFGNDLDHSIRDRLPPGTETAFKIVKWAIDPGLEGDFYSDKPHLYGPLLSSINVLRVGPKATKKDGKYEIPARLHEDGIAEGADGEEAELRKEKQVPEDAAARKKHFLKEDHRKDWEFEEGRVYQGDFFNPYIDFNQFALKLPGFSLSVLGYIDAKQDTLRYVMKNKSTGDVFFVVVFTLVPKEDAEKDGAGVTTAASDGIAKTGDDKKEEYQPKDDDLD